MTTEAKIKHMVQRFLSWKLPKTFNPDNGISFEPSYNNGGIKPVDRDPVGTNLFSATEAEAMVRHMVYDIPLSTIEPNLARQRVYLPTLADLIDRLTIAQLKAIFIPEHREEYRAEIALIEHDVDLLLEERHNAGQRMTGNDVRAIALVMLTNRYIWENETKARAGGPDQDKLLKLTHSINGVRNIAKNEIARSGGERLDHKVDCFAAELVADFGNWNVW